MTEEEAKTKWCPMVRLTDTDGTFNRFGPRADARCIGSECMMWRVDFDDDKPWKEGQTKPTGYCGLART